MRWKLGCRGNHTCGLTLNWSHFSIAHFNIKTEENDWVARKLKYTNIVVLFSCGNKHCGGVYISTNLKKRCGNVKYLTSVSWLLLSHPSDGVFFAVFIILYIFWIKKVSCKRVGWLPKFTCQLKKIYQPLVLEGVNFGPWWLSCRALCHKFVRSPWEDQPCYDVTGFTAFQSFSYSTNLSVSPGTLTHQYVPPLFHSNFL